MGYTTFPGHNAPTIQAQETFMPPASTGDIALRTKIYKMCGPVFARLAVAAVTIATGVYIYKMLDDTPSAGITLLACFIIIGVAVMTYEVPVVPFIRKKCCRRSNPLLNTNDVV